MQTSTNNHPSQPQLSLVRAALYNYRDFYNDSDDPTDPEIVEDIDLALDDSNPWKHMIADKAVDDFINMTQENINFEKDRPYPDVYALNDWQHDLDLLMRLPN